MPTIKANLDAWATSYDWKHEGDEWSAGWGGPEAQWWGSLLPRIHAFVPAGTILEIAPGFGRWTQYLKDLCDNLVIVDLSQTCIDHCRQRFAAEKHISSFVNDGYSLEAVGDETTDFAFSFDSLVHAESDVIRSYLLQLARKLKPNGIGFLHHSNIGSFPRYFALTDRLPRGKGLLTRLGLLNAHHWRARSVTARLFAELADQAGLQCVSQELINWHGKMLIDCISVITRKGSMWARPNRVVENRRFMKEAHHIAALLPSLYTMGSFKDNRDPVNQR